MLRKIRIGISALFFVLITFFFLDFAEILPNSFHRLAHLQFVPALLSLSVGILLFLFKHQIDAVKNKTVCNDIKHL